MRHWLTLLVVVAIGGVVLFTGMEPFTEHVKWYPGEEHLYAALGQGDPDAGRFAQLTPTTFSGAFTATACDSKQLPVPAGTQTIDVVVTALIPSNDIVIDLLDPSGRQVATQDTGTSPEAIHYTAASIPAGQWTVKTCPTGSTNVAPYDYTGVFTTSDAPLPATPGLPTAGPTAPSAGTPTATYTPGTLRFAPETVVDPQRTEGEPVNFIANDGTYWESGPFGTSTQQSWVHRSTDGGLEFHETSPVGLRPDGPPGGGDTDVVADDQGYAYFSDLEGLTQIGTSVSNDGGNTWKKNAVASQETGVDRQWYAVDNGPTPAATDNTIFLVYRQTPAGTQILSSPGSTGTADAIGGLVWTNAASSAGTVAVSSGAPCGKLVFDPVRRNLYMPCGQGNHIEVMVGHVAPGQRTGIDFHTVGLPATPGGGDPTMVFAWLGIDTAGNVMVVWVDGKDHNLYESVSTDGTTTWTAPVKVNTGDAKTNEFPEVAGRAAGEFVITWYGNDSGTSSDAMPANNSATSDKYPWYGYVAVVKGANTLQPTISQQRFTEHPMHYGIVCNSGTTCVSGRTLADYFDVGIDHKGAIRIIFDDESSQYRQAHLMEVRQLVTGPEPKEPMADETKDAQMPHYSPAGVGANVAQADFTKLDLSTPEKGILRVQMSLASLASLAPPPGKPQLVWLTRFQAKSTMPNGAEAYRIFYVGARSTAGGAPTFFAGSGDNPTGCLNISSGGCKIVIYPAEQTLTSGTLNGNTITIDVSLDNGFGPNRTIAGSTLYSVTALSYGQNGDADIYLEGDATHAFDFALGGVPPAVAQPTAKPSGGSGGGGSGGKIDNGVSGGDKSSKSVVTVNHSAIGTGKTRFASFRVYVTSKRMLIRWTQKHVKFHALRLTSARFRKNAAAFRGFAVMNGKHVRFAAVVVDRGKRGDVVKVDWNGGPRRGGVLRAGGVVVK